MLKIHMLEYISNEDQVEMEDMEFQNRTLKRYFVLYDINKKFL